MLWWTLGCTCLLRDIFINDGHFSICSLSLWNQKLNLGASLKLLRQQNIKQVLSLRSFSEITVTLGWWKDDRCLREQFHNVIVTHTWTKVQLAIPSHKLIIRICVCVLPAAGPLGGKQLWKNEKLFRVLWIHKRLKPGIQLILEIRFWQIWLTNS